jgi:quercetin dioxygenase-like cupin family protein
MPIEIRRFGVGYRRPDGPPGTTGITGQVIHSDHRGQVSELAFRRDARIAPHTNPNVTWFLVIEGGGWVQVGDERTRVVAGEAVLWPPDIDHSAGTDRLTTMRAIVVEFSGSFAAAQRLLDGIARPVLPSETDHAPRGEGALAPRRIDRTVVRDDATTEGEPL